MASLRDVLNHIGRPVRLERGGQIVGEGLAIRRSNQAFTEAKVVSEPGDVLRFVEEERSFRVVAVTPEEIHGRVDHYRLDVEPLAAGANRS